MADFFLRLQLMEERRKKHEILRQKIGSCLAKMTALELSKILETRPTTIARLVYGRGISDPTTKKLEARLSALDLPIDPTFQIKELPNDAALNGTKTRKKYLDRIKELIAKYGTPKRAAAAVGLRSSSLNKILSGQRISSITREKLFSTEQTEISRSIARLTQIAELYEKHGTLEAVGKTLGITRERVRQLLVKGRQLGVIQYQPRVPTNISAEEIIEALEATGSLRAVAAERGLEYYALKRVLSANGVTPEQVREAVQSYRKRKAIEDFKALANRVEHYPTATEMQQEPVSRALYARITRYWGSIDTVRKELNIPKPPQGNPRFREISQKKRRTAITDRSDS